MSRIDGQPDLFDELAPATTCPHCGTSWPVRPDEDSDARLSRHVSASGSWADLPGACDVQRLSLIWLRERISIVRPRTPDYTAWGGQELLWTIIYAKRSGCSDQLIQQSIDSASIRSSTD